MKNRSLKNRSMKNRSLKNRSFRDHLEMIREDIINNLYQSIDN